MIANTLGEWLERYWLWMLVALAVCVYAVAWLIPARGDDKTDLLDQARIEALKLKLRREEEHARIVREMDARIAELKAIKSMTDETQRLEALAAFANRKRARLAP